MSRAVTPAHSTSLRNPCPDGTGLGTGDLNGTILLICDAAFYKSSTISLTYEETLGLALGLGIPACLGILFILTLFYNACKQDRLERQVQHQEPQVKRPDPPPITLQTVLSQEAYENLCSDSLTEKLRRELMILRIQIGADLTGFAEQANSLQAPHVARWIQNLFPGDIPNEIRQAAIAKPIRVVSES